MFIMTIPVGGLPAVTGGTSRRVARDLRTKTEPEASIGRAIGDIELRMLILVCGTMQRKATDRIRSTFSWPPVPDERHASQ